MSAHPTIQPRRVLVTGAAGVIGQAVAAELRRRGHFVRGFDIKPSANVDESITSDIADTKAVFDAAATMDAAIHLAAYPNNADFIEVLLGPNVIGLYNICEACREHGVNRLVMASSSQATSRHPKSKPGGMLRPEDGPAPSNHYALAKVWLEDAGEMYARVHGMSVLAIRIGWTPRSLREVPRMDASPMARAIYLSLHDAGVYFSRCVEAEFEGFHILFACSRPADGQHAYDPEPAKTLIGYEPRDAWPQGLLPELADAYRNLHSA